MDFEKIDELIKKRKYEDALSTCLKAQQDDPSAGVEINRRMAKIHYLQSNHADAYLLRSKMVESGDADLRDHYLAGDSAIAIGRYDEAEIIFKKLLQLGEDQNESWFDSAALFFLAYVQMQLKKYDDAISNLDAAVAKEPDCALPIPGSNDFLSHDGLREEILRRSKKAPGRTIYF